MFRYIGLVWDSTDTKQTELTRLLSERIELHSSQWRRHFDHGGTRIFCADSGVGSLAGHVLHGEGGLILGALFERNADFLDETPSSQAKLDAAACREIVASGGRRLISHYWGDYVAFVTDSDSHKTWLLKDPTGNLPCFYTTYGGVTIVFSCLVDCRALKLPTFTPNWSYVGWRLAGGGIDMIHPALNELSQVHRGECIEFSTLGQSRVCRRIFYWNPLSFTEPEYSLVDLDHVRRALRAAVRQCVHTWGGSYDHLLVRLSGGLDSSLVLACLKSAPSRPRVTCYTYYNPSGSSDERRWARGAVAGTSYEHLEYPFDPTIIRLESMMHLLPGTEPPSGIAHDARASLERELCASRGCAAVFSGEGGDSNFGSEAIGLSLDDYLRRNPFGTKSLKIAVDVAIRRDLTVWEVLGRAIRRKIFGFKMDEYGELILKGSTLVAPDVRSLPVEHATYPHPWFSSAHEVPWITIYKLGYLTQTPEFYDPYLDPAQANPITISPLYSQPLVELCLRIPIDVHFFNGKDRGLVREAFSGDVSSCILRRQWKDRAPGYLDELARRNRTFFKQMLLDGILVEKGFLVRKKVEEFLTGELHRDSFELGELFNHLDVEMWLRVLQRDTTWRMAA